jgi:hypothetical protein
MSKKVHRELLFSGFRYLKARLKESAGDDWIGMSGKPGRKKTELR